VVAWRVWLVIFTGSRSGRIPARRWRGLCLRSIRGSPPYTELLIVDEADRLKTPGLEQLRDHYDRSQMGVILIGMPGIEKRLARYPQLYSRIGFVHEYRPLSAGELAFVLQRHWAALGLELSADDFTDTEAIAAVHPHHQRELPARPAALRPDHPRAGDQRTTRHQPGSRRDRARITGHRHALTSDR
jgi:type II secretory pathway predicted ATPase ExeA